MPCLLLLRVRGCSCKKNEQRKGNKTQKGILGTVQRLASPMNVIYMLARVLPAALAPESLSCAVSIYLVYYARACSRTDVPLSLSVSGVVNVVAYITL